MGTALFLVLAGAFLWYLFGRSSTATRTTTVRTEGHVRGDGSFDCKVVGTSHYQDNLLTLAGGKKTEAAQITQRATLVLEDDNPHDRNAVKVYIDTLSVGHLDREMAQGWRAQLRKQKLPLGHFTCDALIVGGWDKGDGDSGSFGVRLDIPVEEEN